MKSSWPWLSASVDGASKSQGNNLKQQGGINDIFRFFATGLSLHFFLSFFISSFSFLSFPLFLFVFPFSISH
jgi:hypothetical protein